MEDGELRLTIYQFGADAVLIAFRADITGYPEKKTFSVKVFFLGGGEAAKSIRYM